MERWREKEYSYMYISVGALWGRLSDSHLHRTQGRSGSCGHFLAGGGRQVAAETLHALPLSS